MLEAGIIFLLPEINSSPLIKPESSAVRDGVNIFIGLWVFLGGAKKTVFKTVGRNRGRSRLVPIGRVNCDKRMLVLPSI